MSLLILLLDEAATRQTKTPHIDQNIITSRLLQIVVLSFAVNHNHLRPGGYNEHHINKRFAIQQVLH